MPSVYLTAVEFEAYLTGDLMARSEADQRNAALDRASAEADSYLRSAGYTLPLTAATATEDVKGRVADVARYRLAVVLRLLPEPASTSSIYLDMQAALAWFREVARGTVTLDLDTGDTSEPGVPVVATNTRRGWDAW